MDSELRKIAKSVYEPTQPLFNFLTMCELSADTSSVPQLGRALKDDETLALIDWWKKQSKQKYTIKVAPGECGYLNHTEHRGWRLSTSIEDMRIDSFCKAHFTKQEIE